MSIQLSVAARNARLDQFETTVGASAKLLLFSGAVPADCAAADPAGLLATITLPADWMNAASGGQKTILGTWTNTASGSGVAASFRIKDNAATTCHMQGTVSTIAAGTGDLQLDNTNIAAGQAVTISAGTGGFTLTDANA